MPAKLIRHGSNAGYRAEISAGNTPCDRCHKAHLVYQTQHTKSGKARGLKYTGAEVIDHLYTGGRAGQGGKRTRAGHDRTAALPGTDASRTSRETDPPARLSGTDPVADGSEPGLGNRLRAAMGRLSIPGANDDYVAVDEPPDYLHSVDADPEPAGEWSEVKDEEFVINAAGMKMIEENMGTYLSIVGMTVEMIDPYCGPILAENFDNMINRWSKVVAHYPKAATLFLDSKGGVLFAWIGALQATWPVLYALYEHHLSKNIKVERGQVYRRTGDGTNAPNFDSTTPPMPEQFAYTAA